MAIMVTTLVLFPIIFTLVAPQAISDLPRFTLHDCLYEGGNYTKDSDYKTNLNHVLSNLPTGDGNGYGFYNISYGEGIDIVHAIGQCRGDTTTEFCRSCLFNATLLLPQKCPEQKEAGGWYEHCMVRYSNRSMARGAAPENRVLWWYVLRNASDAEGLAEALRELLGSLKNKAASAGNLRKYAAGSVMARDFSTVYGLVQCTADLSPVDCNSCLDGSFGYLQGFHMVAARIVLSNCFFKYEIGNLFFDPVPEAPPHVSPPPSPSPPPQQPSSDKGNGRRGTTTVVIVGVSTALVSVMLILISTFVWLRIRKNKITNKFNTRPSYEQIEETETRESMQYSFETIQVATDNFSEANKLGQGGFGPVYKGTLSNGREVAIKRLSGSSGQGDVEFKNEVMLVAKLQHRNLVRLLGFCLQGTERLLVYELIPNGSLDQFIFDPIKRKKLDWNRRYKIIEGVARGLLYLHEDSRLKIVHRDLKASNILLDEEMNPKISDFGTARLFLIDQTHGTTNRVVGTYGYMAPEYVMHGQISVKLDIFSFGVLLLEIVRGQRNSNFNNEESGDQIEDLLSNSWRNWRNGTASNIVDPVARQGPGSEIMRCIHIALLCVQENPVNRPTMNSIVLMLNSNSLSLPVPSEPAFFMHSNTNGSDLPLNLSSVGVQSDHQSETKLIEGSVNEASFSELYPR